jgi:hypothetical protein
LPRLPPPHSKQRTRAHVIADLSVNHVERVALRCGYVVHRFAPDYFTFDEQGLVEEGALWMQLKATDNVKLSRDGKTAPVRIQRRDLLAWISQHYPVILILYDGVRDLAYYLSIQEHFADDIFAKLAGQTVTVPIPTENVLNEAAMRGFALAKLAMAPPKRRPS